MFDYVTFNMKYYILSQIFCKKIGDCLIISEKTNFALQFRGQYTTTQFICLLFAKQSIQYPM